MQIPCRPTKVQNITPNVQIWTRWRQIQHEVENTSYFYFYHLNEEFDIESNKV